MLLGIQDPNAGPLPYDVRVTGTLIATTDTGEQVPVFARIERLSRHYGGPLSKGA